MGGTTRAERLRLDCMLAQSAGILENAQKISPREALEKDFFGELQREKRRIALEVFKKLAPSNINLGGQENNPLRLLVEEIHKKKIEYAEPARLVDAARSICIN